MLLADLPNIQIALKNLLNYYLRIQNLSTSGITFTLYELYLHTMNLLILITITSVLQCVIH